jgi:hypothetical protein
VKHLKEVEGHALYSAIALDNYENLYVIADTRLMVQAPRSGSARVLSTELGHISGMAVKGNNVFISERARHGIRKVLIAVFWSTVNHSYFSKEFKAVVQMLMTLRNHKNSASRFQTAPKEIMLLILSFVSSSNKPQI